MSKDRLERRTYRKSPGRQYGYDYDPLRSSDERSQSGPLDSSAGRHSMMLTQRPDPRRTRQLTRKSILASKAARTMDENEDQEIDQALGKRTQHLEYHEENDSFTSDPYDEYEETGQEPAQQEWDEGWQEFEEDAEPEDYDDYLEEQPRARAIAPHMVDERAATVRRRRPVVGYDEDDYEEEEPPVRRKRRKKKLTRRGLLFGAGAVTVLGVGVAAAELGPKIPQAVSNVGSNIEHQLQDAFNKGLQQGEENIRKEFITALDNLEGFSLQGAIGAAKLTRMAYDVFVSPIIKFGAALTGDFLTGMLQSLKTARGWLAGAFQDNATLQAIQKVLESWVSQVSSMPKQLDAITQTDLDGAQSYLQALQRKLDQEKAKLNNPQTPTTSSTPTQQAKQK